MPDDQQPDDELDHLQERERGRLRGAALLREVKKKHARIRYKRLETLRPAVEEVCRAEYLASWGSNFSADASSLQGKFEARLENLETERKARKLYHELRDLARRLSGFLASVDEFSGGAATVALKRFVAVDPRLPALPDLPTKNHRWLAYNHTDAPGNGMKRTALVWALIQGGFPFDNRNLRPREMAVLSLLLGVGWEDSERIARACKNGGASVADIIEEETKRVGKIGMPPEVPQDEIEIEIGQSTGETSEGIEIEITPTTGGGGVVGGKSSPPQRGG